MKSFQNGTNGLYEGEFEEEIKACEESLAQQSNEQVEPVAFPRNVQEYNEDWIIDPAFISRVKHSIDPETPWDFTPTMEQIEATLLALEVIPASLFTTTPQPKEPKQEPVAWRHSLTGCLFETEEEVPLADGDEWAEPLYTTPPQRKPLLFPTMLRKMWSGGEVQDWLDENYNNIKASA